MSTSPNRSSMAKYLVLVSLIAAAATRMVVSPEGAVRGQNVGGEVTPGSSAVYGPLGERVEFPQGPGSVLLPTKTLESLVAYDPSQDESAEQETATESAAATNTATPTDSGTVEPTSTHNPLIITATPEVTQTPDLSVIWQEPSVTPEHSATPNVPTEEPGYATEIPMSVLTQTPGVWGPTVEPTATPRTQVGGEGYRPAPIQRVDGRRVDQPKTGETSRRDTGSEEGLAELSGLDTSDPDDPAGSGAFVSTSMVDASLWSGDASVSIPLEIPPGPNGHAPKLALSYSSNVVLDVLAQGSSGVGQEEHHSIQASPFGYGWDISELPVISAVPAVPATPGSPNEFHDFEPFEDDRPRGYTLSMGGKTVRLVHPRVDETFNTDSNNRVVYQTYPQSFLYVARTRKATGGGCLYEDRWEVISMDGTHYEFGSRNNIDNNPCSTSTPPADRDAVMRMRFTGGIKHGVWYVTRVWDTWGNSIRYTYRRESTSRGGVTWDAATTIKEITYGGKHEVTPTPPPAGTATPVRGDNRVKIEFVKMETEREDCTIRTSNGDWVCAAGEAPDNTWPHRSKYLIDHIDISIKNQNDAWELQKRYKLKYDYRNRVVAGYTNYKRAMLSAVYESDGKSPERMLPPHRMTYRIFSDTETHRINWLPLETYDNGYGELVKFTYQGNTFANCGNKNHERRPVSVKEIYNRGHDGNMALVSKHEYDYHNSQRCTAKYARDLGGGYLSRYEFLGFGQVTETIKNASDQVVKNKTTDFYRCVDETNGCPDPAEPHPLRGSIKKEVVRSATDQPPAVEKIVDISAPTAVNNHIGYYPTVSIPTPVITYWGKVDRVVEKQHGPIDGSGASASTEKVVNYSYDTLRQSGIQSGLVTGETVYLGLKEETESRPVRNTQRWYTRQEVIAEADFSVSASTYIADRLSREGTYDGGGQQQSALKRAAWYYYDFSSEPIGLNRLGSLTRVSELEAIDNWPAGVAPTFPGATCDAGDQKYRSREREISYHPVTGNPRVDIAHPDYGYVCVDDPGGTAVPRVATDYPIAQYKRETTTEYESILNALPASVTNPLNHTVSHYYFGINMPVTPGSSPTPTPVSTPGYGSHYVGALFMSVDPNGNGTKHYYDGFGRLTVVMKPGDTNSYSPSLAYFYSDARVTLTPVSTPATTLTPQPTATFPKHYYGMVLPVMSEKWVKREPGGQPTDGAAKGVFERTFYDGLGRVVQVQKPHYNWASPTPQDIVSYTEYDALGRAVKASNPYEKPKSLCWGVSSSTCNAFVTPDATRPKTVKTYDVVGRPTSIVGPDGAVVEYRYGVLATATPLPGGTPLPTPGVWMEDVIDPNNHRRQQRYDSNGRLLSVVEFNGVCQNGWPNHACATPVNSQTATPVPWTAISPVNYTYDAMDRLVKVNDSLSYPTPLSITYNQLGHKTTIEDPNFGKWTYEFDGTDKLASLVDGRGTQKICSYYDSLGRIKEQRYVSNSPQATPCLPPAGTPTVSPVGTPGPVYSYDSGTNGKGQRTGANYGVSQKSWTYDNNGRVGSETHAVSGPSGGSYTTVYTYKANDFVNRIELPSITGNDAKLDHHYAPSGAVSRIVAADGSILIDKSVYTAHGAIDVRNYGPNWQYVILDQAYDANTNRLTQSKVGNSGTSDAFQNLTFGYDLAGNVKSVVDPKAGAGQTQTATLDDRDRLKAITVSGGGTGHGDYSDTYQYDDRGNLTQKDGMVYAYHATKVHAARKRYKAGSTQNKTIQVTAKKTAACPYGLWVDLWVNGVAQGSYEFFSTTYYTHSFTNIPITGDDIFDLVISGIDLGGSCALHVDKVTVDTITIEAEGGKMAFDSDHGQDGEEMKLPDDQGTYIKVGEKGSLRFVKSPGAPNPQMGGAYEYDANGNVIFKIVDGKAYQFLWNEENRLSGIQLGGAFGPITQAAFNYDADGGRARATRNEFYMAYYPSQYYEYEETSVSGSWGKKDVQEHVFVDGQQFRLRQGPAWPPANKYWMAQDHLNSTTKILATSPSLYLYSESRYKAWGESRFTSNPAHPTTKRYTGQREDGWGLYYYNARYYDPQLGRFISPDTMVPDPTDPQDLNRYSYVKNNPLRYNDPSGHCAEPITFLACLGLGAAAGFIGVDLYHQVDYLYATGQPMSVGSALLESPRSYVDGAMVGATLAVDAIALAPALQYASMRASTWKASRAAAAEPYELEPYVRPDYPRGDGHHLPAKKAFEGTSGYDPNRALVIPTKQLRALGIRHEDLTGQQTALYSAHYRANGPALNLDDVFRIEAAAMMNAGQGDGIIRQDRLDATVRVIRQGLDGMGISGPSKMPWYR